MNWNDTGHYNKVFGLVTDWIRFHWFVVQDTASKTTLKAAAQLQEVNLNTERQRKRHGPCTSPLARWNPRSELIPALYEKGQAPE